VHINVPIDNTIKFESNIIGLNN